MTNIEDRIKESPERKQKEARNIAIVCGFASLGWYGNSVFQSFTEEGNGKAAIAYALVGTLCAIAAATNYKTYRNHKKSEQ